MKSKRIEHISNILSKRHGIFTENLTIFFFKYMKNWKLAGILI